jgi:hypothetical protein
MQQRRYTGALTAEGLAESLVKFFDPQKDLQAQFFTQNGNTVVQVALGEEPIKERFAVTLGIVPDSDGITVTMGEQQWMDISSATSAAFFTLVGILVTPWAMFGLLWPLSALLASRALPGQVWSQIDQWVTMNGGMLAGTQTLEHPHIPKT